MQKGFDIFRRKNCFGIWNEEEREREMAGRDGWLNVRQTDRHVGGTDRFVVSDTVAARNAVRSASRRIEISSGENRFRTCVTFASYF